MTDCIFCQIAAGQIPAKIVFQDNSVVVFHDINPQAPVHLLIIPRKHISAISAINREDENLMGKLIYIARLEAEKMGLSVSGYRLVFNCGKDAGQDIYHIHLHLLGGRRLHWPPG